MKESKLLSKRIGYSLFCVMGFGFVFFWKTNKNLADWGNILWNAEYIGITIGCSLVLGFLLGSAFAYVFYGLAEGKWKNKISKHQGKREEKKEKWVLGGSVLLILLSWLPSYLAYYPGICAYDSIVQTGEAIDNVYIDHHPILHTMLIKWAMNLGQNCFGDTNTGIGVYTACQMLLLAVAMGYGIMMLHRYKVQVKWQLVVLLGCMFYPFNWYMSVSMTKDIIFSSFMLLQLVALTGILLENRRNWKISANDVVFFLGTIGMILFRNNGKYTMLVPLVFLVLMVWRGKAARKLWSRLLFVCGLAFLIGNIGLTVLFSATHAEQGDRREMLSMPIQQLSRCMLYHGGVGILPEDDNTMSEEDKALINDFILNEGYTGYHPSLADPVKQCTNTYVVRWRTGDFLRTYLHLLTEYPGDFINAGLALTAGFLSPGDESHAYVNASKGVPNLGYVQTHWEEAVLNPRGLYIDSKWEWLHTKMEAWSENNAYLNLPVFKYLFVPGTFFWLYLLWMGYLLIQKRFRFCLPISLVAGYYLTMLLGPTVQLRYVYPVMIALPFLVLLGRKSEDFEYDR